MGMQGSADRQSAGRLGVASAVVVALVLGALVWGAWTSRGSVVHEANLADGGVWVSSDHNARFARVNTQVSQLDAGVAAEVAKGSSLDILQDGNAVVGVSAGGTLVPIDVQTAQSLDSTAAAPAPTTGTGLHVFVPETVDMHGGTIAIVDPETGEVWAQRVDTDTGVESLDRLSTSTDPLVKVGGVAAVTVGLDGAVHVVSGETGKVATIPVAGDSLGKPVVEELPDLEAKAVDITAVGSEWVVYDPTTDQIHAEALDEPIRGGVSSGDSGVAYAALQQPGPEADAVAIAAGTQTRMVGLDGGIPNGGVTVTDLDGGSAGKVARPVVLEGCLHAAWAADDRIHYGANCGDPEPVPAVTLTNKVEADVRDGVEFRVNRGNIVLNDLDAGGVWDLESKPVKIDNWDALIPPRTTDDENEEEDKNLVDDRVRKEPPKAEDDKLTVRAGRTSKLHVLDNDTDTSGSILAISPEGVSQPSIESVRATVSSDGQTVDVSVPEEASGTFRFTYKVNNGQAADKASVTVTIVGPDVNGPPALRQGSAKLAKTVYPALPGGRVSIPVVGDWRDPESDTVVADATAPRTSIDGAGSLTVTAPTKPGRHEIEYAVDDGRGGSTKGTVRVKVLDPQKSDLVAPKTQPDVVRGVVGKPIQLAPLGNDIPGADPTDPQARMTLATEVDTQGSLTVDTDLSSGVVTITPQSAGTFELSYAAKVGGGVSPGRIRIDVTANPDKDAPPVAVPDAATLRDQAPTMVDVLANDYSPRADVLVTRSVSVESDSQWLRPSVYQGRWVRIEALDPAPIGEDAVPRTGTVTYTVSDGSKTATSEIQVVQKPPDNLLLPVVEDDEATVRVGDVVTVPVLDNDTMASGIPLTVDPKSVQIVGEEKKGHAFASGNLLRYVAPVKDTKAPQHVIVEYAAYPEGMKATAQTGRVRLTVMPLPDKTRPNRAPAAKSFSTSVVAGESLTITVPTTGVDPDGDSVTVQGIVGEGTGSVELSLGRVVKFGASTITYEAYPRSSGTEVIHYVVADRFGERSRGFIRVGVVAPGDPQPPVAVLDEVVADPGKNVYVDVLANDLIARGDVIEVAYKDLNDPEELALWKMSDEYVASTKTPEQGAAPRTLIYGISNGIFDPSRSSVLVRGVEGFVNPPTARDDVAEPEPGERTATVDVLKNDDDIDSAPGSLEVVEVLSPHGRVAGSKVEVDVLDHPHTVPYVIEDDDGARAMALVYVPTGDDGAPFLEDGTVIEMDTDSSKSVDIGDHVLSPRDREVAITAAETVSSSPNEHLTVEVTGKDTIELTSHNGYVGPAAVMLEVTDRTSVEQKEFGTAYVSIPVQIGPKTPLLTCPDFQLVVTAAGRPRELDIPTLCHAWVPIGMSLDEAEFEVEWDGGAPEGVEMSQSGTGGRLVTVSADEDAPGGGTGRLRIQAKGATESSVIDVYVVGLDPENVVPASAEATKDDEDRPDPVIEPPRMRPISVSGLEEGETRTIDVSAYLISPLEDPGCRIEAAQIESGAGLEVTHNGCDLTLTAKGEPSQQALVAVVVSDKPGRTAVGRVTVTMLGRPGVPRAVTAQADRELGGRATVSWAPPVYSGGTPITGYKVAWSGGEEVCTASPCTIQGLTNGQEYSFTVAAVNAVGEGEKSAPVGPVTPDTKPGAVTGVRMISRGDGTLTIGWGAVDNKGSEITKYHVRLVDENGRVTDREVAEPASQLQVGGLDNNASQSVKVQAANDAGWGTWSAPVQMQSAGTPPAVGAPALRTRGPGPAQDSESITITWPATTPNGPDLTRYAVYRRHGSGAWQQIATTGPGTRSASDVIPYDGDFYTYVVTATNGAGKESAKANTNGYTSNGQPATPSVRASAPDADKRVRLVVTLGAHRADSYARVTWTSSSGATGAFNCGACPQGGQVAFKTRALGTSAQSFTVRVVNNAGKTSARSNADGAHPYGQTLRPTNMRSGRSGDDITWRWNNRYNGRKIDRIEVDGSFNGRYSPRESFTRRNLDPGTYRLRVRAHSAAGWSPWTSYSSETVPKPPPPPPKITVHGPNVHRTAGSCNTYAYCYEIRFSAQNVKPGTYDLRCFSSAYDQFYEKQDGVTIRSNGSVELHTYCVVDTRNNSWAGITIYDGPSGSVHDKNYNW